MGMNVFNLTFNIEVAKKIILKRLIAKDEVIPVRTNTPEPMVEPTPTATRSNSDICR